MTISSPTRVKKSYSLSVEAERYVRQVRKLRKARSDSDALDQLLREAIELHRRQKIDAAYRRYYDQASEEDLHEEAVWAEVATQEMAELSK